MARLGRSWKDLKQELLRNADFREAYEELEPVLRRSLTLGQRMLEGGVGLEGLRKEGEHADVRRARKLDRSRKA